MNCWNNKRKYKYKRSYITDKLTKTLMQNVKLQNTTRTGSW